MIHNFQELLILVNHCNNQIVSLKAEIKYAEWKSDFKKIAELGAKETLLQIKIKEYINTYKSKIENNYLESRIFGSKLSILENHYQIEKQQLWRK
ncbi:hypothetical protein [Flavobacterium terrigena]|uniref:Uncharacterized protein n=1 Tax=Flavobacterium terrigena TaxID=402734 RepID=A0A1H6QTN5_9FLAO|nr:hypothetical protein [Flavobacterium terrigena]SEI42830.1 hypothetical protein SAMN05660918_0510 [Flavobacterium terrigena]